MTKRILAAAAIVLLLPASAAAHVKWFTEEEAERAPIEAIMSPAFMITALLTAVLLSLLPGLLDKMKTKQPFVKLDKRIASLRHYTFTLLQYGTAAAFVIQFLQGGLFAPELLELQGLLAVVTAVMVVLLLSPLRITVRIASGILIALYLFSVMEFGWLHMLDYVFYLGIAFVLLLYKTRLQAWNYPVLYLTTGLSLCWVAAEKWVYPDMAENVIVNHGVPTFGFSPDLFAMLTGYVEFAVGYLLIVGMLNRVLAVVLTGIFIGTAFLFGWLELVGHFPIHIILFTFIIEGSAFYRPPVAYHQKTWQKMVYVSVHFLFALALILLLYYRFA
ncbi:DoxX family membrane protein [Alkalicoccus luteus]|uniref:DoxX family membrane protein n=1 Tax=Alkalicoccus luteus TaxID=1237094 RepID=A0A969PQG4_9BACI|nr:DoxX family membrane protein [Alkalicoccus luteus]NJP38531.1 DoxX family membrane protein [Alkalicoccus luteus]